MPKCRSRYAIEFTEEERDTLIKAADILCEYKIDPKGDIKRNCGSDFVCQLNTIAEQIKDLLWHGYIKG